jgi:hypothetical protein
MGAPGRRDVFYSVRIHTRATAHCCAHVIATDATRRAKWVIGVDSERELVAALLALYEEPPGGLPVGVIDPPRPLAPVLVSSAPEFDGGMSLTSGDDGGRLNLMSWRAEGTVEEGRRGMGRVRYVTHARARDLMMTVITWTYQDHGSIAMLYDGGALPDPVIVTIDGPAIETRRLMMMALAALDQRFGLRA